MRAIATRYSARMVREFIPINAAVLTVSDTRTLETDTSGQMIADRLTEVGHKIAARAIVVDSEVKIRAQLATWIADDGIEAFVDLGRQQIAQRAAVAIGKGQHDHLIGAARAGEEMPGIERGILRNNAVQPLRQRRSGFGKALPAVGRRDIGGRR